MLARPEAQLSGRARAVVLVANDEAKRPSGSPPRHLSMPSMNSTPRVRPVRSLGGFGRGAQRGCWSAPFWGSAGALPSFAFSAPPARGLLLWGFFGGFRSRCAPPLRSGCLFGWYRRSRARCGQAEVPRFYLTQNLRADLGHTLQGKHSRSGKQQTKQAPQQGKRPSIPATAAFSP